VSEVQDGESSMEPRLNNYNLPSLVLEGGTFMYQQTPSGFVSIEKLSKKGGLTHNLNAIWFPEETVREELKKAYGRYHRIKKDPNSRDTWIGQLIEAQAQTTGKPKKTLWKQLHSREHIQLTAHQVKFVLGKMNAHHPLAIMNKPMDNDGCWECTTKQGLEWACLAEAGRQFTQANQTPCFKPPLWEIFGELGVCH